MDWEAHKLKPQFQSWPIQFAELQIHVIGRKEIENAAHCYDSYITRQLRTTAVSRQEWSRTIHGS